MNAISSSVRALSERALGAWHWALAVAAASGAIAVYLVLAFVHLRHPYELEWMEGGALGHVEHLLEGQPLYVARASSSCHSSTRHATSTTAQPRPSGSARA